MEQWITQLLPWNSTKTDWSLFLANLHVLCQTPAISFISENYSLDKHSLLLYPVNSVPLWKVDSSSSSSKKYKSSELNLAFLAQKNSTGLLPDFQRGEQYKMLVAFFLLQKVIAERIHSNKGLESKATSPWKHKTDDEYLVWNRTTSIIERKT